jgi:superfamily I DNA/RNA helicase
MPTTHANQWFIDYESLDVDQKSLVNGGVLSDGNTIGLVNGPAGSGKTIILVNALARSQSNSIAFISYTRSLLNLADQGLPPNVRAMTYFEAQRDFNHYDLVVIDEVQDVPILALNNIIAKSAKTIMAGDNFQKIFSEGADANSLQVVSNNNIHKLTRTYRLTPRAFAAASKIHPGALEGVSPSGKSVVPIELYYTDSKEEGYALCFETAKREAAKRRTAAILLPNKEIIINFANWILAKEGKPNWNVEMNRFDSPDFGSMNSHLNAHGIKLQVVQNSFGDLNSAFENNEVVLQTYHSAKGLDYQVVCLPNASVEEAGRQDIHKSLFYVAITRASGALIITQQKGNISPYVESIKEFCTTMDPNRVNNNNDDEF